MEDKNIMLSVVIITYKHEKFIEACINGVLIQKTNFPIEIIIGDDCSTDNNQAVITQTVARNTDNLKYFHLLLHDKNLSPELPGKKNFTSCIEAAQGKYIAICEGDDYWTDPLKLQKQVDFLEKNPEYSACFHPVKIWLEDKQEFIPDTITRKVAQTTTINDLIFGNYIHTPSVVYRKRTYPE
jgi:glycosyltransferase involved in cell wall biosynthesis